MKELTQEIIRDAMIEAKYGRDPGSNEPGDLATFFTNVCNENVVAFCALLGAMIQHEVSTESQINTDNIINDPKPGRLQ